MVGSGSARSAEPPLFRLALGTRLSPDSEGTRTGLIVTFLGFPRAKGGLEEGLERGARGRGRSHRGLENEEICIGSGP